MFIVNLTYVKPLDEVEKYIAAHREFLDMQYANGIFLASGPKNPRDGGIILVSGDTSRNELETVLDSDPFKHHGLAEYHVTEFTPVKHTAAWGGRL
ncbi:MAG TPA: YciI family protein [Ochrobactrum sp.]|nr:YciI family protein [Ochrobactrum sp.]